MKEDKSTQGTDTTAIDHKVTQHGIAHNKNYRVAFETGNTSTWYLKLVKFHFARL
jgi:hypothetical protein